MESLLRFSWEEYVFVFLNQNLLAGIWFGSVGPSIIIGKLGFNFNFNSNLVESWDNIDLIFNTHQPTHPAEKVSKSIKTPNFNSNNNLYGNWVIIHFNTNPSTPLVEQKKKSPRKTNFSLTNILQSSIRTSTSSSILDEFSINFLKCSTQASVINFNFYLNFNQT